MLTPFCDTVLRLHFFWKSDKVYARVNDIRKNKQRGYNGCPCFTNTNTRPICKCKVVCQREKNFAWTSLLKDQAVGPVVPGCCCSLFAALMQNAARVGSRICVCCSHCHLGAFRPGQFHPLVCKHPRWTQWNVGLSVYSNGCGATSIRRTRHRPFSFRFAAFRSYCSQASCTLHCSQQEAHDQSPCQVSVVSKLRCNLGSALQKAHDLGLWNPWWWHVQEARCGECFRWPRVQVFLQ